MIDLNPGQAIAVDWTMGQYLADRDCVSSSGLRMLVPGSKRYNPELYYRTRISRELEADASTRSQGLGTLIHMATLEPQEWARRMPPPKDPPPGWVGSPAAWRRQRVAAIEAARAAGLEPLEGSEADIVLAARIASRIWQHPFAKKLLDLPGDVEQTIIWREPDHGLLVRVRPDKVSVLPDGGLAVPDLKSTRDPHPRSFARAIEDYGYHVQAALYVDALRALHPDRDVLFGFIAAGTSKPWKIGAWPLADRAVDLGREQYRRALDNLAERLESGDWREAWESDYSPIDLADRAYRNPV